jgi:hypothetical protein
MRISPTKLEVALFLIDEKDEVEDRLTGSTILEAECTVSHIDKDKDKERAKRGMRSLRTENEA